MTFTNVLCITGIALLITIILAWVVKEVYNYETKVRKIKETCMRCKQSVGR